MLKRAIVAVGVMPAVLLGIMGLAYGYRIHLSNKWQNHIQLPMSSAAGRSERVMVFAPHCDDETLGVGGTICRAVRAGASVHVVMMTNGDGFRVAAERALHRIVLTPDQYVAFAYRRQRETIHALSVLGVKPGSITFLGYPDRGLARMWTDYWDVQHPYKSFYTKRVASPYANSYHPNAPYCGESVIDDLQSLLEKFQPTMLFIPHPSDAHPDHYATYCFVMAAVEQLKARNDQFARNLRIRTYLVHRGDWPVPKGYHPKQPLSPPFALTRSGTRWEAVPLDDGLVAIKRRAISAHRTQTAVMGKFLQSFVRRNELFGEVQPSAIERVADGSMSTDGETSDWRHIPPCIQDATGDNVLRDFYKSADVRSVYLCADSKRLYVRVDLVRNISARIHYRVRIRGFGPKPDDDERSFEVVPGKRSIPDHLLYAWHNRTMELSLPLEHFATDRRLFVTVETAGMGASIDRTGWRAIELPPLKQTARTPLSARS